MVNLDVPSTKKSQSVSKAAAILALKGEILNKKDPNYVSKRKRSEEEVEESKRKVTKTLNKSSTDKEQDEISVKDHERPKKQVCTNTQRAKKFKKVQAKKNS